MDAWTINEQNMQTTCFFHCGHVSRIQNKKSLLISSRASVQDANTCMICTSNHAKIMKNKYARHTQKTECIVWGRVSLWMCKRASASHSPDCLINMSQDIASNSTSTLNTLLAIDSMKNTATAASHAACTSGSFDMLSGHADDSLLL